MQLTKINKVCSNSTAEEIKTRVWKQRGLSESQSLDVTLTPFFSVGLPTKEIGYNFILY